MQTATLRFGSLRYLLIVAMIVTAPAHCADRIEITRFGSNTATGTADAVLVASADLVHTTQVLPAADAGSTPAEQVRSVLERLDLIIAELGATRSDVIKLNIYVAVPDGQASVLSELAAWCEDGGEPAVSFVTTPLPETSAEAALDAVFAVHVSQGVGARTHLHLDRLGGDARESHATVLPRGDVIYVAGQAEPGDLPNATRATLDGLLRTLHHLGLNRDDITSLKCFVQPMSGVDAVQDQIAAFFGDATIPPVSYLEWISSEKQPIEIELVARAPAQASAGTLTYYTLPWLTTSPIYSRAVRIHGDRRLYVSGTYADQAGDGEHQVRSVFAQWERILQMAGSDLRHLAKATYYVLNDDASSQLNKLRPQYFDPQRPPAASKAMVRGVGRPDRSLTLDLIAAPVK